MTRRLVLAVVAALLVGAAPASAHAPSVARVDRIAVKRAVKRAAADPLYGGLRPGPAQVEVRYPDGAHTRCAVVSVPVFLVSGSDGVAWYRTCVRLHPWRVWTRRAGGVG